MRVVIAGGAGALGRRLATDFEGAGHDVVILTRSPKSDLRFRQALWDGRAVGDWASELEGAIVVNLAGELVDRRPTASKSCQHRDARSVSSSSRPNASA